jgi:Holliday junction resolvasome RuvABC DNA-binding subunit
MPSLLFSRQKVKERIEWMEKYVMLEDELDDAEWCKVYENKKQANSDIEIDENAINDSISALQALGYKKKDAERYTTDAFNQGAITPQDVITYALKLARKEKVLSS